MLDHILLVSHDTIGDQIAGPGIRYLHMARVLARHANLLLAIPSDSPPWQDENSAEIHVVRYSRGQWSTLEPHALGCRVVICSPDTFAGFPELAGGDWCLAMDDYDPLLSEWLAETALKQTTAQETAEAAWRQRMNAILPHWLHGDFFFCASERQRDWMLGILEAMGRMNLHTYGEDHTLRRLIDVVPTGLPAVPPVHTRSVFRNTWPGIQQNDLLLLWGGGLWPWLDPLTAIHAVHQARNQLSNLKLLFPGTRRPNTNISELRTLLPEVQLLTQSLNLQDCVLFGDWMPYKDWPNALLEADLALTLHIDSLETRLAFRSRVLDYIWAGLPTIASAGDATSDLIQHYGLGIVVAPGNASAVAEAIIALARVGRPLPGANFERARQALSWEVVLQPLIHFCLHPRKAPDKIAMPGRLGPPYFVAKAEEASHWKSISDAYANGRFMRFMRWLKGG